MQQTQDYIKLYLNIVIIDEMHVRRQEMSCELFAALGVVS